MMLIPAPENAWNTDTTVQAYMNMQCPQRQGADNMELQQSLKMQQTENPELTIQQVLARGQTPTPQLPDDFVSRLDLKEARILTPHTISVFFKTRIQAIRDYMRAVFVKALLCQVDFITGDANLFCNMQFTREVRGNKCGGLVLEVLEDALKRFYQPRCHIRQIYCTISRSTQSSEFFCEMEDVTEEERNLTVFCSSPFFW